MRKRKSLGKHGRCVPAGALPRQKKIALLALAYIKYEK